MTYREADLHWEQRPEAITHRDVAGVAVDSADNVYLFTRFDHQVLVYSPEGKFLRAWGAGTFTNAHNIRIGPDGAVYCVDNGDHSVRKFTPDGELLLTLGVPGTPSQTGYRTDLPVRIHNVETVARPAGPFNGCTDIAIGPAGDIFVSDGYGNCRVHHFSASGKLLNSWGEIGDGPGQFRLPHGICLAPDGRLLVADRENDRIQIFSPDGEYLSEWTDTQRPTHLVFDAQGRAYVSELWWHKGDSAPRQGRKITDPLYGRVSVFDRDGRLLTRWGTPEATAAGSFAAPHGIAVDSRGDIYVAEVTWTFAVSRGRVPANCHTFQKFTHKA